MIKLLHYVLVVRQLQNLFNFRTSLKPISKSDKEIRLIITALITAI